MEALNQTVSEAAEKKYRNTSNFFVGGAWLLIAVAVAAPILSILDSVLEWAPSFESAEVWFQRSGALTTIFALLTNQIKELGSRALHIPGTYGGVVKLQVLAEFERRFQVIFVIAFCLTVLGTLVWGYGDTAYKYFYLGLR
ncbi:hypothetical protein [Pseudomonas sp. GD03746]|uniref:hypothetical protein n=1 Tax=Pseudomonas sp. GD03746 TaxID=2975378 RepID=UPI00244A2436|nr:hypothetical protein [Pseudomonas sp. GD03746]MDH1575471.1 hypothetical protein [Pseudomonas sp. GD03746]